MVYDRDKKEKEKPSTTKKRLLLKRAKRNTKRVRRMY